jgi:hypothetical protein
MRRLQPVLVGVVAAVAVLLIAAAIDPWGLLPNPFEKKTIDRSAPAVLNRLSDLSEYKAATAQLQELIDVEHDVRFVPSVISGDRATFLAFGTVDAVVDFGEIGRGAVAVTDDRKTVRIVLPHARIADVHVDPARSKVVNRQRGVLDRIGGVFSDNPTSERELFQLSEQRLTKAAQASKLRARAESNTRSMLRSLLTSLGFEDITIDFESSSRL